VGDDLQAVARCEKKVQEELSNHVSAARSHPYYLDVTHPAANKGSVVNFLAAVYLMPKTSIATLGDMRNHCPDVQKKRYEHRDGQRQQGSTIGGELFYWFK
jgi:hydroxymethylpyrimidine pyrophosphatase-like HAD family hydrolase